MGKTTLLALAPAAFFLALAFPLHPNQWTVARASSEAEIVVTFRFVVLASDISLADGVTLTFSCTPGESEDRHKNDTGRGHEEHGNGKGLGHEGEGELCPSVVDVTVTVADSGGNVLGTSSLAGVAVPGSAYFDFSPDVPIAPITSITVSAAIP